MTALKRGAGACKKEEGGDPTREPVTPIKVVPIRPEGGGLLQLPRVWSEPDRCGSHSTLLLDDLELKVIHYLGTAIQSKAITEGVIVVMKALDVTARFSLVVFLIIFICVCMYLYVLVCD